MKAEGKWLTPAQKAAKARADAMLEAMRAQGAEVCVKIEPIFCCFDQFLHDTEHRYQWQGRRN